MTEILDQSDLADRAARLVEAAGKAGADAADAVCVRGMSLSVDVRLGKVEETRRAEGDDFTLRVFLGKRSATVSANVLADPAELATRAVAMARVAPEDRFAGLADPDRLARTRPDVDILDPAIPAAAELTEAALATEDAARAVPGVTGGSPSVELVQFADEDHLDPAHQDGLGPHLQWEREQRRRPPEVRRPNTSGHALIFIQEILLSTTARWETAPDPGGDHDVHSRSTLLISM